MPEIRGNHVHRPLSPVWGRVNLPLFCRTSRPQRNNPGTVPLLQERKRCLGEELTRGDRRCSVRRAVHGRRDAEHRARAAKVARLMRCEIPGCTNYATDIHHIFTRGAHGRAALTPDNEIFLCREHHTEAHTIGRETWAKKYKQGERVRRAREAVRPHTSLADEIGDTSLANVRRRRSEQEKGARPLR